MKDNIKQYVSSDVCLSCDGCCRFSDGASIWRPIVMYDEAREVKRAVRSSDRRIGTREENGQHICHFLKIDDNHCTMYDVRPFECRLYPFMIVCENDDLVVCVHTVCPHIIATKGSPEYQKYLEYLRIFFKNPGVQEYLKKQRGIFSTYSEYAQELEKLFNIEGL